MSNQLAQDVILTANSGLSQARSQQAQDAEAELDLMISTMNGEVAGRSIFSGIATDQTPIADAETLLSAVRTEISGLSDLDDILATIDTWFSDPAGFDAVMYNGSDRTLAPIQIAEDVRVSFELKANDPQFKRALQMTVAIAISDDDGLALSHTERMDLMQEASASLLAASSELAEVSGSLGALQAWVETSSVRNSASRTSLKIVRIELV